MASVKPSPDETAATPRFSAVLHERNVPGSTTFVTVPPEVMASFAPRRRVAVVATIAGHTWRTTITPYGTECHVAVNAAVRAATGTACGDPVEVELRRDDAPREVMLPDDLAAALAAAGVRAAFAKFAYSHQLEYVRWVEAAKRPQTRADRIAKTAEAARHGHRPC